MKWANFLHADTNIGKLKATLIIIWWVWSKMGKALLIMGLLSQVYITIDLMNWADWSNDLYMLVVVEGIIFGLTANLLSMFNI